jgi:hypothetical protein
MKRHFAAWTAALLLVASGSASVSAQASTFDIATFTAPPGWAMEQTADHLVLTIIDNARRVFCQLIVYASQPASSEPLTDFATEWNAVVASTFNMKSDLSPAQSRTAAGASFVEAGADVEQNNRGFYARLTVFLVNGCAQSVLALATDRAVFKTYAGQVTPFFASFRYAAQGGSGPRDIGSFRAKGAAGVWMTFTTRIGSYEPTPRWMTLFTDGQIYDDLPREGLDLHARQDQALAHGCRDADEDHGGKQQI